jgi:hypothetical protein
MNSVMYTLLIAILFLSLMLSKESAILLSPLRLFFFYIRHQIFLINNCEALRPKGRSFSVR